jgi:uncharacterized glyoxalase superfamily protein PhnB
MLCLISTWAQVKLSFNPEPGMKFEYHMEVIQSIKQNVMGQEMPMETEMNGTYLMEIKDKTSQEIHAQFTYQGFTFLISSPMMSIRYDSKNTIENPSEMDKMFEKMFSTLIGQSFIVIFAPDGSVKSVSGMGAITENMLGAISADGQVAAQMGAQMSQQFSDEAMKNMFGQSFNFYPDNAVKVGDSWIIENTIPMNNMNFGFKTNNTLIEISTNKATIEVTGDIDMDMEEGKFTGTQTGTMIVDTTTGIPVTSDISLDMKGTIQTHGMNIQMEMTTNTKMSVKEIN